ncbi:fungal-specific transcription factor domain-containing protein [Zychaea mexicana]|uniref:fungal-specific transcription factor domain-containing protein n=1 Tax=Zychaea mexicana TaxID=64656 RepID=UPI0022FDFAE5|nr:fungal-specific transcription factor domain-containing protein [Zychaea mexicana]KAI9489239.1 fungal-specific transcription factor domain-containing protein [Zychaea mexicana]
MERILGGLADEDEEESPADDIKRENEMTHQAEKGNSPSFTPGTGAEQQQNNSKDGNNGKLVPGSATATTTATATTSTTATPTTTTTATAVSTTTTEKPADATTGSKSNSKGNCNWKHDTSGLSSLDSTGITRYVGDMSPLPFLAQKINFEDARVASTIGFKVRKFGHSLLLYKEDDQERAQGASERMLRAAGKLKPGQSINGMNDWIYAVAGIDRVTSDRLMRIYFAYIHPGLPVINKILFLKQYRRQLGDYPAPTLLCAIYGAAVRYVHNCRLFGDKVLDDEPDNWDLQEGWSENLFEHLLVYVKGRYAPCVATIQALVIGQFHRASLDEKVASGWLLNSAATRMAQDLGLHRSSEGWDIPDSEKETRRRLWWAVYIMDKWSAAGTGRPQTIFDEDCDEIYPSESSSWEEVMDTPPKQDEEEEGDSDNGPRFPSLDPSVAQRVKIDRIPIYQPFVQLAKLSELLGRILQGLYTPRAKRHSAQHGSDVIVSYLDNALSEWRSNLPPSLQISSTNVSRLDSRGHSPLLSMSGLIYLTYCTLLVLLHRPFIEREKEGHDTRLSMSSLTICTNAATRCVDIAEKMHYRDFMLVSWSFSIYPVFTASLIHIFNAASTDNIVADVAKSNIIKAMGVIKRLSKLSPAAGKLFDVLKQLMETRNISVGEHVLSDLTDDDQHQSSANKGKRKRRQRRASYTSPSVAPPIPLSSSTQQQPKSPVVSSAMSVSPTCTSAKPGGFKIGMSPRTSDVGRGSGAGSLSPLPAPIATSANTALYNNNPPPDRPSSGGSTPSSIVNGDWINGLCSTWDQDTLQSLSANQKDSNDMHSLRQFGLSMESMFPAVDQLASVPAAAATAAAPNLQPQHQQQQQQQQQHQQQHHQNNLAGSMMLPFHSTDSFLFGIPDFGFTTAAQQQDLTPSQQQQQQQQHAMTPFSTSLYTTPTSAQASSSSPSSAAATNNMAVPQLQQQQRQQHNQFRNRPDNPFWSMPSSLELDDWTAYLLPQQQQDDSLQQQQSIAPSASSHHNTSTNSQPWNPPSNGWM